ncbi:hypothetical protein OHB24_17155 [Kribbella sp. NBC_00482]|uniref:hypothetical protein n=1 Tax=Kribbella sp. NBC_00482 TaxID=2975968 RepID=UPI002E171CB2
MRIPVGEFARLWLVAERRADAEEAAGAPEDGYLSGVCATCEWLACVFVGGGVEGGSRAFARPSPITGEYELAYEELIAEETCAAEREVARLDLAWGSGPSEPGFVDGVLATLLWAWRRSGVPPIDAQQSQARQTG